MKCQHCGNNLNIEDRFCPYCGQPNPFAVKHQEEMDRYEKDYQETKEDVLEQSSRFNRHTVRITIIAVLVALIAVTCFLLAKADDIVDGKLDTSKVKAFLAKKGQVVEVYETSLHYAPCSAKKGDGFKVAIVLPKGTNGAVPALKAHNDEDKWMTAWTNSRPDSRPWPWKSAPR